MKEKYTELTEKHNLPQLQEMEKNFEIHTIEDEGQLLRSVMRKMGDKIEFYAKILDELVHPDSNLTGMYECNIFNSEEKKEMFQTFRKLVFYHRHYLQNDLDYDEDKAALFIKEFWQEWPSIKNKLNNTLEKMKEVWMQENAEQTDEAYFG